MSKELEAIVKDDLELSTQHIKITPYAVEIEGKPSTEEWYEAFQKIGRINGLTQFFLGDLVVCAEFEWGDKYTELIDLTGYDYQTLRDYATVARRFSPTFREEICRDVTTNQLPSFNAFRTVQSIDDERAKYFLRMVVDGKWSVIKLREEVKRYKNGGTLPEPREKVEQVIPDGWERVKQFGLGGYVPNMVIEGEVDEMTFLVEVTESEAEDLINHLKGNMKFTAVVEKLIAGLRGLNQL
jgi:hypothetical protein